MWAEDRADLEASYLGESDPVYAKQHLPHPERGRMGKLSHIKAAADLRMTRMSVIIHPQRLRPASHHSMDLSFALAMRSVVV